LEAAVPEQVVPTDPRLEARQGFEEEVMAAERFFAIRAAYDGIRTAFLSVLSEDSVIDGPGPRPGRSTFQALPSDHQARLLWEPVRVAASIDGTLAFTTGPYRRLDGEGRETSVGVYISVWRRHSLSGHYELVIDFGAEGAEFPEDTGSLSRSLPSEAGTAKLESCLAACLEDRRCPDIGSALCLGIPGGDRTPAGFHLSEDRSLGVLWGSRSLPGGSLGVFVQALAADEGEPVSLAYLGA
jgi:hypothetical protein